MQALRQLNRRHSWSPPATEKFQCHRAGTKEQFCQLDSTMQLFGSSENLQIRKPIHFTTGSIFQLFPIRNTLLTHAAYSLGKKDHSLDVIEEYMGSRVVFRALRYWIKNSHCYWIVPRYLTAAKWRLRSRPRPKRPRWTTEKSI